MSVFQIIDQWADRHHYRLLDLLRILLGVVIFAKGYYFISHTDELIGILAHSKFPWVSFALAHYVALVHLAGGVLIAIGLLTRLSCAFQIPILLGAVVFVHSELGFYSNNPDLALSLTVLSLLVFFFFYGSGTVSVDHSFQSQKPD